MRFLSGLILLVLAFHGVPAFTVRLEIYSEGRRALLPVPQIIKEPLPIPGYDPYTEFR